MVEFQLVLNALTFQKVGIGFARYSMRLLEQIQNSIGNIEEKIQKNNALFEFQANAFDQIAESVKALNESAQALELLAKKF
jgi:methyl-accepting chemotaxis protein